MNWNRMIQDLQSEAWEWSIVPFIGRVRCLVILIIKQKKRIEFWHEKYFTSFFFIYNGRCLLFGKNHFLILFLAGEVLSWPLKCRVLRVKCHSQYVLIKAIHLGKGKHLSNVWSCTPRSELSAMFESTVEEAEKELNENASFFDIILTLNKISRNKASFWSIFQLNVL